MYCVNRRYLANSQCKFKAFLELVKRVYRLDPLLNTPRKDIQRKDGGSGNAASRDRATSPMIARNPKLFFPDFDSSDSDFQY